MSDFGWHQSVTDPIPFPELSSILYFLFLHFLFFLMFASVSN
jgi:hypothetical protein